MFPIHLVQFILKKGGKSSFSLGWDKPEQVNQQQPIRGKAKATYDYSVQEPVDNYANKKKNSNFYTKDDQYQKNLNNYHVYI
jgi:hypothetical protein